MGKKNFRWTHQPVMVNSAPTSVTSRSPCVMLRGCLAWLRPAPAPITKACQNTVYWTQKSLLCLPLTKPGSHEQRFCRLCNGSQSCLEPSQMGPTCLSHFSHISLILLLHYLLPSAISLPLQPLPHLYFALFSTTLPSLP